MMLHTLTPRSRAQLNIGQASFTSKAQVSNIENDNVESATSLVGEGFALHGHQNGMMKMLKVSSQVKVRIIL